MTITYNPNDGQYHAVQGAKMLCSGVGPLHMTFKELCEYMAQRALIIELTKDNKG